MLGIELEGGGQLGWTVLRLAVGEENGAEGDGVRRAESTSTSFFEGNGEGRASMKSHRRVGCHACRWPCPPVTQSDFSQVPPLAAE